MQFKFKQQQYQADAAKAVTDVFAGQPNAGAALYLRDIGQIAAKQGVQAISGIGAQMESAEGYGNHRVELPAARLLENIHAVQREYGIQESAMLAKGVGAVSLDVEMETGTGKTYVYIKTMYELNRLYGWDKFIIVVPSIAIREGVYKSFQTTSQHFFEQYGKGIRYFVYNSSHLNELDVYSQSPDINAMIINMQAFNTSLNEDKNVEGRSGNEAARIMYSERDEFGSRKPIDVLAANHPIIIQDEPQKMGGKATKEGIKRFQPLFCLNYSATHKERHDLVYALDALDAYNQRLVKRIEVKGFELKDMKGTDGYLYLQDIRVSRTKPPMAVIEYKKLNASGSVHKAKGSFYEHFDVYEASGKLEAYRDGFVVGEVVPDAVDRSGYVTFLNGIRLGRGEVYGSSEERDMRRVQIRETILSHLEKEEALFSRGIKCLSLFFIDEVAKYRVYNDDGTEGLGEYGHIFEEEYARAVEDILEGQLSSSPEYRAYLAGIDPHETHKGYFSIDKKGHTVDSKVKRGSNESDDESAYDLILKDKERLLSFDEPTRFIFSHSALREGWDNPNVFQICTLKHSDSETGKRQEVGRGLRLCVNQDGERQDAETLEDEVQKVNSLTVIASESYADFVVALQSDITSALRERPKKVTEALFRGLTLPDGKGGAKYTLTDDDAHDIYFALVLRQLVDKDGAPTGKFREQGLSGLADGDLGEHLDAYQVQIEAVVRSVYDEHAMDGMFDNGLQSKTRKNPLNGNFKRKEFQELWNRINSKHSYTISFDGEELRRKAIEMIDMELLVSKTTYVMTAGVQQERQTADALEKRESFDRTRHEEHEVAGDAITVTYDLLGEVAARAHITRKSAAAILKGIHPQRFAMFKENPEEFIAKTGDLINAAKATMIVDHITYRRLDDRYDSTIFTDKMPESTSRELSVSRCIQDYVFWDSEGERDFASDLDTAEGKVVVYAKLPRSFKIPTPVGDYAPDWAIAFEKESVRHVFFVAETKGSMSSLELRGVETAKIACARKLFNEASDSDVRYGMVDSYESLIKVVNGD